MFCFTYAGGTSSFFDGIEKDLKGLELVKLEYAGHGTRHKESFYQDFDELADDMFQRLKKRYWGGRYSLFGYSMGTIALVEVQKRILANNEIDAPSHVSLVAHEPHSKAEMIGFTNDELDEWVKDRTVRFGSVPDKLLNNKSFWRMYLPIYRADYGIISKYSFEALNLRTTIPATIFYSEIDTPLVEMKRWKKYFIGRCDFFQYDGTHFFIQNHHAEMADVIKNVWESK